MAGFTTKVVAAAYFYEKMARKEKKRGKEVSVFILSTSRERLERSFRNPLY
jgi:hypothetical protein